MLVMLYVLVRWLIFHLRCRITRSIITSEISINNIITLKVSEILLLIYMFVKGVVNILFTQKDVTFNTKTTDDQSIKIVSEKLECKEL